MIVKLELKDVIWIQNTKTKLKTIHFIILLKEQIYKMFKAKVMDRDTDERYSRMHMTIYTF